MVERPMLAEIIVRTGKKRPFNNGDRAFPPGPTSTPFKVLLLFNVNMDGNTVFPHMRLPPIQDIAGFMLKNMTDGMS
jgi:hypothetical protein